jgi:hypothetical protein
VLGKVGGRSGTYKPRHVLPPQIRVLRSRSALTAHALNDMPAVAQSHRPDG